MHNQHISQTVQDEPTNSVIENLFSDPSEIHQINTQRGERCCDLSRGCAGLWNNGAVRQEKACSQMRTT